jgi:hypothetical protein
MDAEIRSFYTDFYGITDMTLLDEFVSRFEKSVANNR